MDAVNPDTLRNEKIKPIVGPIVLYLNWKLDQQEDRLEVRSQFSWRALKIGSIAIAAIYVAIVACAWYLSPNTVHTFTQNFWVTTIGMLFAVGWWLIVLRLDYRHGPWLTVDWKNRRLLLPAKKLSLPLDNVVGWQFYFGPYDNYWRAQWIVLVEEEDQIARYLIYSGLGPGVGPSVRTQQKSRKRRRVLELIDEVATKTGIPSVESNC